VNRNPIDVKFRLRSFVRLGKQEASKLVVVLLVDRDDRVVGKFLQQFRDEAKRPVLGALRLERSLAQSEDIRGVVEGCLSDDDPCLAVHGTVSP